MPIENENGAATALAVKLDAPAQAALESKVSKGLADVFTSDDAVETPADETADTSAEETQEEGVKSDEEADKEVVAEESDKKEEDGEQQEEKTEEQEEKAAAAPPTKGNAPTLPDAYRRSLKAYGWEDEDIDTNLKALGGSFVVTAQKIHQNRNAEVAQWAEAGRAAREANKPKEGQQQSQAFQTIKPVDAAALKEHYGNDALIDSLIGPLNSVVAQINAVVPQIQQTQQRSQIAEVETLGRQVESFFTSKELQPFAEMYGDATKGTLTDETWKTRNKVLEMADALLQGAPRLGRNMSFQEALTLAHDSVSSGFKAKAARKEIVATLKKREKGITLKPGNKAANSGSFGSPARTRTEMESKVKRGLASVFG